MKDSKERLVRVVLLEKQMAERRARIVAAAQAIIGERGYAALTMRDLARASRVTVPTIYNLIGSKEEVLVAAVADRTQRYVARVAACAELPPCERVLAIVEAIVDEFLDVPNYYRAMLGLIYASPAAASLRVRTSREVQQPLARALEELSAAGELVEWASPHALANQIESLAQVASLRWATGGIGDEEMRIAATYATALLLLGVARGPSRALLEQAARRAQAARSWPASGAELEAALAGESRS
jgi:AcrR family transcriptional regulator